MLLINSIMLQNWRQLWRSIPDNVSEKNPDIVSRVSLDENGTIVPIFERRGYFCVYADQVQIEFEKLDDAEIFAAGLACSSTVENGGLYE